MNGSKKLSALSEARLKLLESESEVAAREERLKLLYQLVSTKDKED
jgi:hypothetical protein